MKAAVFASGTGTNFDALVAAQKDGKLKAEIVCLMADQPNAKALEKAKSYDIKAQYFNPKSYANKAAFEKDLIAWLTAQEIELIILSGYMRIVGPTLLEAYPQRIVNLHPALLPNFPGAHAILDAYQAGVSQTGVTVHYIDEGIDTGPLIIQEPVDIDPSWSLEELEQAVHAKEYDLFYRGINQAIEQIKADQK